MKTTHQKFHPTATPPEGAVYIGSEGGWDHYIRGNTLLCIAGVSRLEPTIEDVLRWSDRGNDNWHSAATLIRAHREKQATPTPITREGIIETLARAGYDYLRATGAFDRLSIEGREKILGAAEAQAIAIGVVKLAPAPEPEPVRSDGEKIAAAMIRSQGKWLQFYDADGAFCEFLMEAGSDAETAMRSFRAVVAKTFDAALDTRDRQHAETLRKELEALRERIIVKLRSEGFGNYIINKIRAVPLTIAERSAK